VAVEEANRRVLDAAASDPTLEGMGTTLVVALEVGDELSIASVGDSRAYLLDQRLPRDHGRPELGQRSGPAAGP
jgi:serine/threonine protein phosphatase PrpC